MLIAYTLLLAGCGAQNTFVPPPPPQVSVAQPVVREIADSIEFVGNTAAVATVDLRARVNGYLQEIRFEDGAMVEEGQLLFVIEPAPFESALEIARAELARAQADLQLQQTEYRRIEPLVAQQAVTQAELDQQAAELATAQANIMAAQAAVRNAQLELSYTEIRAPISGRIGRHLVDRGNLVQAEQTLLARIETLDPIHAYFNVSESDLLRFREMMRKNELPDPDTHPVKLYLQLANEKGFPHEGHVDFRELGVDPASGTALRRGVFENPNNELLPGLFVRIRAPIAHPEPRLLVEERAIGTDQRGDYLLVVNDKDVVEYRLVDLGISTDGMRVINEGVGSHEWIVVNGLQRARPGATVQPERVAMGQAASDAQVASSSNTSSSSGSTDEAPAKPTAARASASGVDDEAASARRTSASRTEAKPQ